MKAFTIISGIFACLTCLSSCSDEGVPSLPEQNSPHSRSVGSSEVTLQWTTEKQKIDGFGVAQAGWADYLYAHRKRNEVMDILFGQDGLKLSILRGEVFPHYWENAADKDFNLDADINLSLDDPFFVTDFSADGNEA
ncbi:MAG: glycoside hydrolase, partial [Bacteroides sp.]